MHSAIYEGTVRHRRYRPCVNNFLYPLFMLYADLEELDDAFRAPGWSTRHWNLAWFRRGDYMKSQPAANLADAVRDFVESRTGNRPTGPIRLLTHFRYFGFGMNPVSFYYCFNTAGTRVEFVLAEINNTPWGEQFTYVLPREESVTGGRTLNFGFSKAFHVSPFMPMDLQYQWRFSEPVQGLAIHMENRDANGTLFDATLALRRIEISPSRLTGLLVRYPVITLQVVARIYWQALRLWWKNAPFIEHPKHFRKESTVHADRMPSGLVATFASESDSARRARAPASISLIPAVDSKERLPHNP